jgi:hypothetical protein
VRDTVSKSFYREHDVAILPDDVNHTPSGPPQVLGAILGAHWLWASKARFSRAGARTAHIANHLELEGFILATLPISPAWYKLEAVLRHHLNIREPIPHHTLERQGVNLEFINFYPLLAALSCPIVKKPW